jgi:hypothetical protein
MDIENSIELRPRFQMDVSKSVDSILQDAASLKDEVIEDYRIKVSDRHIFFFITLAKRKYYSPHLHIELTPNDDNTTHVKGLFGPDQTVWTFFMFLHFFVGGLFLIFMMMAYSHWSLNQSVVVDFSVMFFMAILWMLLYFQARINRKKCAPQMYKLEDLMNRLFQ